MPAEAAPTPVAPATPRAVANSASDSTLFGKYVAQHEAEVAKGLDEPSPKPARSDNGKQPSRDDAKANQPIHDDDSSTAREGSGADIDEPEAAAERRRAAPDAAPSGVSEAVDKARAAWAAGDTEALDSALKAILPGSKGLSEFAVDGKRYAELRTVAVKRKQQADERDRAIAVREGNVSRGLAQVEQLVARYQPIEQLVHAAQADDVDAFVKLVETVTRKPLNETVKRHLDRKLNKPGDPEVDNLKRTLAEERRARLELEQKLERDKQTAAQTQQIQRHLVFLDEALKASPDARVRSLVASPAGMRAIFEAQKAHYNKQTNTTLTPEQAARFVLEQKAKEIAPWQQVLSPAETPPAPPKPVTPPARPLGGSRGNGASGASSKPLSDTDLFAKYERLAKLAND